MHTGEISLGLFDLTLQLLHRSGILANVLTNLLFEDLGEMFSESLVKVFTTKMSVTRGGHNFEDTVINGQDGDIESTTTEIEHKNVLLFVAGLGFLVKTIGDSGSSGLIDDTADIDTRDETSILSSLSLGIIEVSRHSNDGVLDFTAEVVLSNFFHLSKNHSGDFLGGEGLNTNLGHLN
mmetsp:Transcript_80324/g.111215  ORF Transcript_80324/g.111215 Transcript_80324/m.111215 type:complete len:179 (-) Transcript_80324:431-967(-)